MFDSLTDKLNEVFKRLRGHGTLTEENIDESLREVRLALLEADVNFKVVRSFLERVRQRAVGRDVIESLSPGQQVVKVVYEELTALMGSEATRLYTGGQPPAVFMLVGLQGSGKTTTAGKLAKHLREQGRRPLLVAADLQRPAAQEQLQTLGKTIGVEVYRSAGAGSAVTVCQEAVSQAKSRLLDPVILDTAGRLHIDEPLMAELRAIKAEVKPAEILMVADAMTGQDAVTSATAFHQALEVTGYILTKLDGDTRGGAALSIRSVTGAPIKFVGVGEKLDALELFHPDRMASRILGMGDVLSLVERAEQVVDAKQAATLEKKLKTQRFTLEDFRDQLRQIRNMGPLEQLIGMIPGLSRMKGLPDSTQQEKELRRVEAIIDSMTPGERQRPEVLNGSRRKRIASGSGTDVAAVNRLLKQFAEMQKMMRQLVQRGKGGRLPRNMPFPLH
ncbi:MAG TPA: signal recognition particle protein [Candidatus Sulfotelmatobacter sp.]|nr:signal recognition particle protein [Candidatus Sulfotelmatobacter sp.]